MEEVAPPRVLPFMFLGGPLDHTTRKLSVEGPLLTPPEEYVMPVFGTRLVVPGTPTHEIPRKRYLRTRVTDSRRSWWAFVLEGHSPPRSHLLDASPFPNF